METGAKVIRKVDARHEVAIFGTLESIQGKRATVHWHLPQRQQHSTLALSSLIEVSPEMERDIRAKNKARLEKIQAEHNAKFVWLCKNVNPQSRHEGQGHRRPLPLQESQVVDGKCFYCGHPVVPREVQA
jgi:hypothetical protein